MNKGKLETIKPKKMEQIIIHSNSMCCAVSDFPFPSVHIALLGVSELCVQLGHDKGQAGTLYVVSLLRNRLPQILPQVFENVSYMLMGSHPIYLHGKN